MSAAAVIQRVRDEKGWSRDKIAAVFVSKYRFRAPDKKRDARSFAAEIRKLEGGDATWFERRPPAAALIAEILDSTPAELGISSGDDLVPFFDFPELRSLDLATEDPFAIENWAPLLSEATSRPIWFSAGHGMGKSLFARWAERRGYAARIAGASLSSVERQVLETLASLGPARHLIVDVDRVEPSDLAAQQRLGDKRLIVLAPELRPHRKDNPGAWGDLTFTNETFDRRRFVDWIAHRLSEGTTIADKLWRKVISFDPSGTLIVTPDDVIQFLGVVFEKRDVNVLDVLVDRAARRSGSAWLASHGRDVFRELAIARWFDTRTPYGRPAPRDFWEGYISSELAAPRDRAAVRAALEAMQRHRGANVDKVAEQLLHDRRSLISLLEDVRLLVRSGDGELNLHPRWLVHELVVQHVRSLIASDPKRACSVAVDITRRAVLDEVLANADAETWSGFVAAAANSCKGDDLASISLVESAFAAFARRYERGHQSKQPRALEQILARQMELLLPRYEGVPRGPTTRPGPSVTGGVLFVADCWTWSIAFPRPSKFAIQAPWLLPGWEAEAPSELEPWLRGLDVLGSGDAPERLRKTLSKLVTRWTPRRWENVPNWMALVLLAAEADWFLDPRQWVGIVRDERATSELQHRLQLMDVELAAKVARRIWTASAHLSLWEMIALLKGPLGAGLVDAFEPELVEVALPKWGPEVPTDLGRVPTCLRGPLVRWILDNDRNKADLMASQALHLEARDHSLLIRLADFPMGFLAIDHLWQVAPEVAAQVLERRLAENSNDAASWLEGSASSTEAILDVVERHPPSDAVRRWAARRMLNQPWLADRLWALVRRVSPQA